MTRTNSQLVSRSRGLDLMHTLWLRALFLFAALMLALNLAAEVSAEVVVDKNAGETQAGLSMDGVRRELSKAYQERLDRLETIRASLENGEAIDMSMIEEVLDEPRGKQRLEIEFEREYLEGLERFFLEQERQRRAQLAIDRAEAERAAKEAAQSASTADAGIVSQAESKAASPVVVLTDAEIRGSRFPGPLADLLYDQGRYEEARVAYEAIALLPSGLQPEWAMYRIGQCAWKLGDLESADSRFEAALSAYPSGEWAAMSTLARETIVLEKALVEEQGRLQSIGAATDSSNDPDTGAGDADDSDPETGEGGGDE